MWLSLFSGERTRSHFFGEQVESFLNIDMYRRPATTYTGRVVMDYGRPGDGYYTQRFPSLFHEHLGSFCSQAVAPPQLLLWLDRNVYIFIIMLPLMPKHYLAKK